MAAHWAESPTEVKVWKCPFGVLPVTKDRVCSAAAHLGEAASWARRLGVRDFFDEYGDPPRRVERALLRMPSEQSSSDKECPICFASTEGTNTRTLSCGHIYHQACIDRWLRLGNTACPMCRKPVRELTVHQVPVVDCIRDALSL